MARSPVSGPDNTDRGQPLPVTETTPYTDQRGNPTAPQPSALGASPDPGYRQDPPNVVGQSEYTRQHREGGLSPYTTEHLKPEQQALNPDDQAKCDALYEQLKPEATMEARNYVLARTPELYQETMVAKIEADWPVPPADDPEVLESKRHDRESYKRSADPNPNFDPNMQAGNIGTAQGQADQQTQTNPPAYPDFPNPAQSRGTEYPNYPQR